MAKSVSDVVVTGKRVVRSPTANACRPSLSFSAPRERRISTRAKVRLMVRLSWIVISADTAIAATSADTSRISSSRSRDEYAARDVASCLRASASL